MLHPWPLRLVAAIGFTIAAGSVASAKQQVGQPPPPPAQAERPRVVIRDGRVTVTGQNMPLASLLDEISRRADVALVRGDDGADELVSIDFQDLAIDEALRRLLVNRDAFFFYGGGKDRPAALRVVWIYAAGRGRGLAPVPPEAWASTKELEERLHDDDPETRAAAIETLVERRRGQSRLAVLQALKDGDERVRTRALYAALAGEIELSGDILLEAFSDQSANVRFLALGALAEHPDFAAIARRALQDPNAHVRARAEEMLAQRDPAARLRPPAVQKPPKR